MAVLLQEAVTVVGWAALGAGAGLAAVIVGVYVYFALRLARVDREHGASSAGARSELQPTRRDRP
jgi:hypothetical protein